MHYHTTLVPLRLVARSSEKVGGVGAGNGSQQIYDLVRNPKPETQQQMTVLFGIELAVSLWFNVSPAVFDVQCQ